MVRSAPHTGAGGGRVHFAQERGGGEREESGGAGGGRRAERCVAPPRAAGRDRGGGRGGRSPTRGAARGGGRSLAEKPQGVVGVSPRGTGVCPAREETRSQPHPPRPPGPGGSHLPEGWGSGPGLENGGGSSAERGGGHECSSSRWPGPRSAVPGAQPLGAGPPLIRPGWSQQSCSQTKGGLQTQQKENAGYNKHVFATTAQRSLNFKVLAARA